MFWYELGFFCTNSKKVKLSVKAIGGSTMFFTSLSYFIEFLQSFKLLFYSF